LLADAGGEIHSHPFQRLDTQAITAFGQAKQVCMDRSELVGVDVDLVVRPFGRKGSNFTTRDFDRGAMRFHFGMQPVETVPDDDPDQDGDGVFEEVLGGEMSALAIYNTNLERPYMSPLTSQQEAGFKLFQYAECGSCHRPVMTSDSSILYYSHPEVANDPDANQFAKKDLSDGPTWFDQDPNGSGLCIYLFSDLKRHKMGAGLQETLINQSVSENQTFITPRLWGVADSAPYLHDGRAMNLHQAILAHAGDADDSKLKYAGLPQSEKEAMLAFLGALRVPDCVSNDLDGGQQCPPPVEDGSLHDLCAQLAQPQSPISLKF